MDDSGKNNIKKILSVALFVFAAFGFIESVLSISSAFRSTDSRLEATIYPSKPKIPYYFYVSMGDDFKDNSRSFLDVLGKSCENRPKSATSSNEETDKDHACAHIEDLKFFSEQIEKAYALSGTVFDVVIENKGKSTAKGIKISSNNIIHFDAFSGGSYTKTPYNADSQYYQIPDLNPGEKISIEVWQSGRPFIYEPLYDFESPKITYDGPPVSINMKTYADSDKWEIAEFFLDNGPVVGIILVTAVGTSLLFGFVVCIVVFTGLIQGKSLKEIFQEENKQETSEPKK